MSAFYAEDFDREFHLGPIIGGRIDSQPLWSLERWQTWISSLEKLVGRARAVPAVDGCHNKNWDGPATMRNFVNYSSSEWHQPAPNEGVFISWDLLAPGNRKCARERHSPDVYVSLSNLRMARPLPPEPHTLIVFAIGADLPLAEQLLDDAMLNIAASVPAMLTAKTRRPWGFGTGIGYNNGISETQWLTSSLLSRDELSPAVLREKWECVEIVGGQTEGDAN